jgi:hypothetical protein
MMALVTYRLLIWPPSQSPKRYTPAVNRRLIVGSAKPV